MKRLTLTILCLFLAIGLAISQTQNVKGLVVDEAGEPVIGATVAVQGTTTGTVTDFDGNFSLTVSSTAKELTFSYIGYETITQQIAPNMKVVMKASRDIELGTVVVTGMVEIDKRMSTGQADKLNADAVKLDGIADISRGLEGRSAGVSVQNISGTFGTKPMIRVRGRTSIYGDSSPLWVVDGVIMENIKDVSADDLSSGDPATLISSAIAGLNADDIESFTILKDGSATSIYGARAMAGVIVITTKRGVQGTTQVNYTGEFTMRMRPSYSDFNIMNSQEQMGIYKELQDKGWLNLADTYRAQESGVYGRMYQLINTVDPATGLFALQNTPEARNAYLRQAEMRNTDWFKELFDVNVMHNHSVSVSSGNEKSSYYASLSAMFDPGWYKSSKVKRFTANLKTDYKITKDVTLALLSNASYRKQNAPGSLSRQIDATSGIISRGFDINPYSYALNSSRTLDADEYYTRNYAPFNISNELSNNNMELNVVDLKFQGELKWRIMPGLDVGVLAAMKYATTSQEHRIMDESNQALAYRTMPDATVIDKNPYLYKDPDNPYDLPISLLPEGGIYQRTDYKMRGYDFRANFNWRKQFEEKHFTSLYGGMELNALDRQSTFFRGWGLQYSMGEIPYYIYQYFKSSQESNSPYYEIVKNTSRMASFFALGSYNYDSRYTVSATFRYEGSNKLGKSRSARWLPTWNIAGKWDVNNEKFFENISSVFSHLSLNLSYSLTADGTLGGTSNSQIIINSYMPNRPTASTQETGLQIIDLENSELTYEKKHEFNIGLQAGFLNNRLNFEFAWYKRNNYDLIGDIYTQGVGGSTQKRANVASMKSDGVEFTVSSLNLKQKDFSWNTDFIFGYARTKVTDLISVQRLTTFVSGLGFAREGYPARSLFSIPFVGLNEDGIPMFINQDGEVTSTDINFQELRKLDFLKYEGPSEPTHTGSLGNTFKYKGITLNVYCTYAFGSKVRLDPVFSHSYSDLTASPKEFKNRWIMPGDENVTDIPVILSQRQYEENRTLRNAYSAYNYSTARVAKGDFIRLKEISVGYDFPQSWLPKNINRLSLKLQATNLFLLYADSKLNGQDPEFMNAGGVAAPLPRQFTFTLRLGL